MTSQNLLLKNTLKIITIVKILSLQIKKKNSTAIFKESILESGRGLPLT